MTEISDITEQPSAIDGYNQPQPAGFHHVTSVMNAIGTVWILVLMVLINTDVIGRDLFGVPVRGVTEIVSMSIVGIVFMQLADTLRAGRFTRAEVLLGALQRHFPRTSRGLQGVFHVIGASLMVVICWASWQPFIEAVRIGEYTGAVGDFTAPMWPVRLIIVVGSACTSLSFLFIAWNDFKAVWGRQ